MDPSIKWHQNETEVIITVDLKDIINYTVNFEIDKVSFNCSIKPNILTNEIITYKKELNLNNPIDVDNCKYELKSEFKIYLKKKEVKIWDKLTKEKTSNVFIDWSNWIFIDEVPSKIKDKDNIVNNNIKEALATIDIPKSLTDTELINQFELSDSDSE